MNVKEELEDRLIVGVKIRIGKEYADYSQSFKEGDIIELIEGYFEYENGLYTEEQKCPSIPSGHDDFDSIYHLFGNDLENFKDCEIL
jgi:hypothetical protein